MTFGMQRPPKVDHRIPGQAPHLPAFLPPASYSSSALGFILLTHRAASHFHAFAFAFLLPAMPPTLLSDPANSSCSSETHLKLVLLQGAFSAHPPHTTPHLSPAFCHVDCVLLFMSLTPWEHGAP